MEVEPLSELVRSLLSRRGVVSPEEVAAFLAPDYVAHTHDPFLLMGMDIAVERVFFAIENNERIAVYADFDCDGIPGASILFDLFTKIGYENFEVYLPHRDREGYGFHVDAIDKLASGAVKLIITVDVGTVAFEGIAHARARAIDVIVTDHHDLQSEVPEAFALLNPKRDPPASSGVERYPFPYLCGAGMAFKLAQALIIEGKRRNSEGFTKIPDGWEKWLLDLVAIATVADMVPLVGENRALVYWGLQVLRKSPRPGIVALCNKARVQRNQLSENDIGFSIAPRINAASRMGEPDLALRLLTTKSPAEAEDLADKLEKLNAKRKGVVAAIVKDARKRLKERHVEGERVIVLGNTEWKPALLGLAANSIMQERGGVVCLWGRDGNGDLKGSCRSDGRLGVTDLFKSASDAFIEYGGHQASGGFSVSHESVHTLHEVLAEAASRLERGDVIRTNDHDAIITIREISTSLLRDISRLSPFGAGNPKPIFKIPRSVVVSVRTFGKENNHVEIMLSCNDTGINVRAFDFFRTPEQFSHTPIVGESADIIATLECDSFRNSLALRLVDVLAS